MWYSLVFLYLVQHRLFYLNLGLAAPLLYFSSLSLEAIYFESFFYIVFFSIQFLSSADHEKDWRPCPVDPYSAVCADHTYIHAYFG